MYSTQYLSVINLSNVNTVKKFVNNLLNPLLLQGNKRINRIFFL